MGVRKASLLEPKTPARGAAAGVRSPAEPRPVTKQLRGDRRNSGRRTLVQAWLEHGRADIAQDQELADSIQARWQPAPKPTPPMLAFELARVATAERQRSAMSAALGISVRDVPLHFDARLPAGVQASAEGGAIHFAPGAYQPETTLGRFRIAHEFAHIVQMRGGNRHGGLDVASRDTAEWQARQAAADLLAGVRPTLSRYTGGGALYDDGKAAVDDAKTLAFVLKILETQTDATQRSRAIEIVADLALGDGPVREQAHKRMVELLSGNPNKEIGDHISAVEAVKARIGPSHRPYDLLLYARLWWADHSKNEIGSELVIGVFQKYLHYGDGSLATIFFRLRITGSDKLKQNLAARIVADLLERENTPEAKKYRKNYQNLRAMAMANGWESFGPLGMASATGRLYSALEAVRGQVDALARTIDLGPTGDPLGDQDKTRLEGLRNGLDILGLQKTAPTQDNPTGKIIFSARNREETEHEILFYDASADAAWLLEMADTMSLAVDFGSLVQDRIDALHANAKALDDLTGGKAESSDERVALFDLRHEYIDVWLSGILSTFGRGKTDIAGGYRARFDMTDTKFEEFDRVIAVRKFKSARARFHQYSPYWNQAKEAYPGNDRLQESFYFDMRTQLDDDHKYLSSRFATGFSSNVGGVTVLVAPSDDYISDNLLNAIQLDQESALFSFRSALFLVYANSLNIHNSMIKADVGNKSFRAEQGQKLIDMRVEMQGYWRNNQWQTFMDRADGYGKTIERVVEAMKDRVKRDILIDLAITVVAALVTSGAALALRMAALSRTLALVRTARAIASFSTLVEVGVFTTTQLGLQGAFLGKDITVASSLKALGTNLAFLGALKAVGKFAEPFAPNSAVKKLMFGHLVGFTGVAGVSATLTKIETGEWPPDVWAFLGHTAASYLLLVGVHHAFQSFVTTPALKSAAGSRLEALNVENQALMDRLRAKVESGQLTRAEFEQMRADRIKLLEEARAVGKILHEANVITAADMKAINKMADDAVSQAQGASFPVAGVAADASIKALPAPESVDGLVQVGDSRTYVYDPAKPRTQIDTMLTVYKEKGYTVEGTNALTRIVDPRGRTRFLLTAAPVPATRLLLPQGKTTTTASTLERATGLTGPQLDNARATLARINREAETKLTTEYDDYPALLTMSLLLEHSATMATPWPIDGVRGLAEAMSLSKAIPRSAMRRLFLAVPPAKMPDLLSKYYEVSTSPNVSPGTQFLIADDLLPKNSIALIDAWRAMKKAGIELPADMDLRATRGVLRMMDGDPNWLTKLARLSKDKRADHLRTISGLNDPRVTLPKNVTELLAQMTADIPGHPGLDPTFGPNAEAFVKELETRAPASTWDDPRMRASYVLKVENLRLDVAMLQQGKALAHGSWEQIVGRANEVRKLASVFLKGVNILVTDREVGPKGQLPNVDMTYLVLPTGGKVVNVAREKDVHMDLMYSDASGTLTAMEMTTAELGLPAALAALDPQSPTFGQDVDYGALDSSVSSHRKFMQALKIVQLNQIATALGTAWSGTPAKPANMVMSAGDFTAPAARALERLGFKLETFHGIETAAQIEARKSGKKTP